MKVQRSVVFGLACVSPVSMAADINVPADYSTIQAAVTAASSGDTIILATGTYREQVTIVGKSLTIRSSSPTTDNGATVLSGDLNSNTLPDAVIFTVSGGGSLSLSGLTLQDALHAVFGEDGDLDLSYCRFFDNLAPVGEYGGAVRWITTNGILYPLDIEIDNCLFEGNEADWGGAIQATGATITISNSVFEENVAVGEFHHAGDGGVGINDGQGGACWIAVNDSAVIEDSVFRSNETLDMPFPAAGPTRGGAVRVSADSMVFSGCVFDLNQASNLGSAVYGIIDTNPLEIEQCEFRKNTGDPAVVTTGGMVRVAGSSFVRNEGAIRCDILEALACEFFENSADGSAAYSHQDATVVNCLFYANESTGSAPGALDCAGGMLVNSRFYDNDSASGPGALVADGDLVVSHSTFYNNVGGSGEVMSFFPDTGLTVEVRNTIIWESTAPTGELVSESGAGSLDISHSIVRGGLSFGTRVIDFDPLLISLPSNGGDGFGDDPSTTGTDESANDTIGTLGIDSESPAIDFGVLAYLPLDVLDVDADTNLTEYLPLDAEGNARRHDDLGTYDVNDLGNDPLPDLGAVEFQGQSCRIDFDDDGYFTNADVNLFASLVLAQDPEADLNYDGVVDNADITVFVALSSVGCS